MKKENGENDWGEITVPSFFKTLRSFVEIECKKKELNDDPNVLADYLECENNQPKGAGDKMSKAKSFFEKAVKVIIKVVNEDSKLAETDILKNYSKVIKAIKNEEELLQILLPDFRSNPNGRWPGPVSYRSGINHIVAISIRVHALYPEADTKVILQAAARRIIVPSVAHNLTFLRRENNETLNFILKSPHGLNRLKNTQPLKISDYKAVVTKDEYKVGVRWIRFFNALLNFGVQLEKFSEMIEEIQQLTSEYEVNPTSSKLWSELSLIASGDLSIDELLVSKVTADLEDKLGHSDLKPIVSFAKTRFELLSYSYSMKHERECIATKPAATLLECENLLSDLATRKIDINNTVVKIFGWAYLWSRFLLLKDYKTIPTKSQIKAAELVENLLREAYRESPNDTYKKIALRYLVGYLTNPRFIRPPQHIAKALDYLKANRDIPDGIVSMARARIHLHNAAAIGTAKINEYHKALHASLAEYSHTLRSITGAEYSSSTMDGEVSAWIIPEMRFSIQLLKDSLTETGNDKKSEEYKLERLQKSLDTIGEMQFGIYFNQDDEDKRLIHGLKISLNN